MGMFFGQNKVVVVPLPPVISDIMYGRLYNWYAASNPLIAPVGWRVPTLADIEETLTFIDPAYVPWDTNNYNGRSEIGGSILAENDLTYWNDEGIEHTDDYSFAFKGCGWRTTNSFSEMKSAGNIWLNAQEDATFGMAMYIDARFPSVDVWSYQKFYGNALRLVKEDSTLVSSLTDLDGNIYPTTKIGNKVWITRNWACTKLNNNTPIPNIVIADNTWSGLTTAARCDYNDNIVNVFLP